MLKRNEYDDDFRKMGWELEVWAIFITGLLHLADRSRSDLRLDPLGSDNREYLLCWEWGERV